MYEVQVSHKQDGKEWRINSRFFVITEDPCEAIRMATECLTEPKVVQLHWRSETKNIINPSKKRY
jgi:hypothetical protein